MTSVLYHFRTAFLGTPTLLSGTDGRTYCRIPETESETGRIPSVPQYRHQHHDAGTNSTTTRPSRHAIPRIKCKPGCQSAIVPVFSGSVRESCRDPLCPASIATASQTGTGQYCSCRNMESRDAADCLCPAGDRTAPQDTSESGNAPPWNKMAARQPKKLMHVMQNRFIEPALNPNRPSDSPGRFRWRKWCFRASCPLLPEA